MRWLFHCAYDGRDFAGWQSQFDGRGVQDAVEAAFLSITGEKLRLHTGTRTDAGVHALAHPFHVDCDWRHPPDAFRNAVNSVLPSGVRIISAKKVSPRFHARHDSLGKRYTYTFTDQMIHPTQRGLVWQVRCPRLDFVSMQAVAPIFVGRHNFRAFSAQPDDVRGRSLSPVKTLWHSRLVRTGRHSFRYEVEGSGFLYHMVRSLVGGIVQVGKGRLDPEMLPHLLAGGRRTHHIPTCPPDGLFLEKVFYRLPARAKPFMEKAEGQDGEDE
jgi:tRNA pseudouridine38-40 synthase